MTRKRLSCPYCGEKIRAVTGVEGRPWMQENVVTGFECDDYRCSAEWSLDGEPTNQPFPSTPLNAGI